MKTSLDDRESCTRHTRFSVQLKTKLVSRFKAAEYWKAH